MPNTSFAAYFICSNIDDNEEMAKIIKNNKVKDEIFLMSIEDKAIAKSASPGQFVHIRVTNTSHQSPVTSHQSYYPLLRRPFSIHNTEGSIFEILYKVIGIGTRLLSEKREGEKLDVIGPLGKGFNYQSPVTSHQLPVLIGGGMGVAPLYFLAKAINRQPSTVNCQLLILLGAKSASELIYKKFEKLGDLSLTTEDGSIGKKGLITDLLKSQLTTHNSQLTTIFTCGPIGMLREVRAFAIKNKIPCEMSLEENMCCGIGACLSCAVKTHSQLSTLNSQLSYKYVCKDGPVFKTEEIEI